MSILHSFIVVLQIQLEGQGQPPITVADYLKQSFGYRYNFMGAVVGILLAFTIFFAGTALHAAWFMHWCNRTLVRDVLGQQAASRMLCECECPVPKLETIVVAALAVLSLKYMKFQVRKLARHRKHASSCQHRHTAAT